MRASQALCSAYIALTRPSRRSLAGQVGIGAAAYALILVVLVVFRISGTSMGLFYAQFFNGSDPNLIAGTPRAIRSDEWLVVAPLTVAQVQQGLPRMSDVLPGGLDTSILWDLPYREWSVLLRPHQWGFFFLPIDNAFAFRWWFPFLAMTAIVYTFLCLLWRRPLASFAVAGAFAVSPFFQWWFGAGSFWPPACAVAACAATVIMLRSDRAWLRWVLGAVVAYLVAVAVVALYPPYLIPCLYPALGFCIGWFFTSSAATRPWRDRLRQLVPLGVGAVAVAVVLMLFLTTRSESVHAILTTAYPGQRLWPTGMSANFPWTAMYAGVFGMGLRSADLTGFAPNASEGSSFIFFGLYLMPSAIWLVWSRWRRGRGVDWALVAVAGGLALLVAFVYVPGWDTLAHLLLLDRTATPRIVIGIGLSSVLLLGIIVSRLRDVDSRIPLWTTLAAVGAVLLNHAALWSYLTHNARATLAASAGSLVLVGALTVAIGLFSRGWMTVPGILVAVVALVVGGRVNPIYRGVLDLRSTAIGQDIMSVNNSSPGTWVAVSGLGSTAVLRETGVIAYSGVQGWPAMEMWKAIDPNNSEKNLWNRYAHINWTLDPAAPEIALAQADVVQLRFDACGHLAQVNIDYVLSDRPVRQRCLNFVTSAPQNANIYYIYHVVKKS